MMYVPLSGTYEYSEWLGNIPDFAHGTYKGVYERGENNLQVLYRNVQESYLDEYVDAVCAYGYEVKEDNVIGENRSITLVGEQGLVHVGYFKYTSFDSFLAKTLPTYIPKYYPNVKIIKPHMGQILKFCNVEFEVLYAQEHFAPGKMSQLNDSSLVLRMNVNGQTVLFTGDAEATVSGHLCKMYGNYLRSDILQINHHGYSGGTVELYDLVNPIYTLWPTSQDAFDLRTTGKKYTWVSAGAVISNKHIYDKVGRAKCFVADGPVEILHFPLKDKLVDIKYYNHS